MKTLALAVRRSGDDTKWRELANLLSEIFTPAAIANELAEEGARYDTGTIEPPKSSPSQKLVIFTEHRDTLSYLKTAHVHLAWGAPRPSSASTAAWVVKSA